MVILCVGFVCFLIGCVRVGSVVRFVLNMCCFEEDVDVRFVCVVGIVIFVVFFVGGVVFYDVFVLVVMVFFLGGGGC